MIAAELDQHHVQRQCDHIRESQGFTEALQQLYDIEIDLGYIEPERLNDNRWFHFSDSRYGVTFETQINYLRHHYQQDMLKQKNQQRLECAICFENMSLPHKHHLRVFEFELSPGQDFFAQLTPYPLFQRHFVLIARDHRPMQMDQQSVQDLCDFVDLAPSYTACSNSDVPMAGASILSHHHYQVFDALQLPIQSAQAIHSKTADETNIAILNYPIACLRVSSANKQQAISQAGNIIRNWRQQHDNNTCNLLVHKSHHHYQIYIILRNPAHITPTKIHPIKSEGIGIVEVSGCGIYPVPRGENEETIWHTIENHGLDVIHTIISSNSPVAEKNYQDIFTRLTSN